MGKIKITKRDLKEDEVKTFGVKLLTYAKENYTILIIALGIVVVGLIGFKLYQYRQQIVLRESNRLFTFAINLYEQGLMRESDPKRREDYLRESIRYCEQLLRDFPNARLAPIALYLEGNAYYMLNDFDQAITIFQRYVESTTDELEKAKGYVALGYSFENKFFYQRTDQSILRQAMRSYERAIEMGKDSYIAYEAMLCKARLLELMGKNDDAIALYEKVMNDRKFVIDELKQQMAMQDKTKRGQKELTMEQQILKGINDALSIFTFYKTAELDLTRLRGQTSENTSSSTE
ncbi:tetratricopeptide repeat protein [Candidatus Sumerlaeota bacterium]|nr:tetratricopeptide repeat protein [Candidatus Sumerlaeota bacterium]